VPRLWSGLVCPATERFARCSFHSSQTPGPSFGRRQHGQSSRFFSGSSLPATGAMLSASKTPRKAHLPSSAFQFSGRKPFIWFYIYFGIHRRHLLRRVVEVSPHKWFATGRCWALPSSSSPPISRSRSPSPSTTGTAPSMTHPGCALGKTRPVTLAEFFSELATFMGIALVAVIVGVLTRFFISHYVFRWRTAMNDYYTDNWAKPAHRGRCRPARAGRHHALCLHHGGPWQEPDRFRDDAHRLPARAAAPLQGRDGHSGDRQRFPTRWSLWP
jgi:hypothetical protein